MAIYTRSKITLDHDSIQEMFDTQDYSNLWEYQTSTLTTLLAQLHELIHSNSHPKYLRAAQEILKILNDNFEELTDEQN
jgi:hypothetical protein